VITSHKFRASSKTTHTRGVDLGMCMWLGKCNRPREEHATAVSGAHAAKRAARAAR
jgi:hypothetical protein